jgi:hypothetical protein
MGCWRGGNASVWLGQTAVTLPLPALSCYAAGGGELELELREFRLTC